MECNALDWFTKNSDSLTGEQLVNFYKFVLHGLYELERLNLIHGDVNLRHILVKDGQFKIGDIGKCIFKDD